MSSVNDYNSDKVYPDSLYDTLAVLGVILLILSGILFVIAALLPAEQRAKLFQHLWRKRIF